VLFDVINPFAVCIRFFIFFLVLCVGNVEELLIYSNYYGHRGNLDSKLWKHLSCNLACLCPSKIANPGAGLFPFKPKPVDSWMKHP
jgi:hypothetical protein